MGISKAYGMARAQRFTGRGGRIVVMTGDGELQEGQIWESLQPAANERLSEIIVDRRSQQAAVGLGGRRRSAISVRSKTSSAPSAGTCAAPTATTSRAIRDAFAHFATVTDRPKVLIADTIKGKGVSFMEGLACGDQTYHFHAGAPSLKDYLAAARRADRARSTRGCRRSASAPLDADAGAAAGPHGAVEAGAARARLRRRAAADGAHAPRTSSCMDGDLLSDCGIEAFKEELPERFIECGIAEQHMVSAAGGMALRGMLPVVHSFACFLSTRANEHIYNNATERRKIIYTATLAGVVPGGPGHSHQSVRDISAIGSVPGLTAIEPCSEREARLAIRWAVETERRAAPTCGSSTCRSICRTRCRRRTRCRSAAASRCATGADVALVGYGPLLMTNAWRAADELAAQGIRAAVINLPWLNRIDEAWVSDALGALPAVVTLDNHYVTLGQGVMVGAALARTGSARRVPLARPHRRARLRQQRRSARASRPRRGRRSRGRSRRRRQPVRARAAR